MKNFLSAASMAIFFLWCAPAHAEKCNLGAEVPHRVSLSGSVVVIFRDDQCFGVYENGRIAHRDVSESGWYVRRPLYGWASTGSDANATPLSDPSQGPQRVVRSSRDHRSKEIRIKVGGRWVDAPMPFALFFDANGRAIHAGYVRRERASHGCVRIPMAAAQALFDGFDHRSLQIIIVSNRDALQEQWERGSSSDPIVATERPRNLQVFPWNGVNFGAQFPNFEFESE